MQWWNFLTVDHSHQGGACDRGRDSHLGGGSLRAGGVGHCVSETELFSIYKCIIHDKLCNIAQRLTLGDHRNLLGICKPNKSTFNKPGLLLNYHDLSYPPLPPRPRPPPPPSSPPIPAALWLDQRKSKRPISNFPWFDPTTSLNKSDEITIHTSASFAMREQFVCQIFWYPL